MTTLPPPSVQKADENSTEKKIYNLVDQFAEYIEVPNERYRLSYNLYKFVNGEGDGPAIAIRAAKIQYKGISETELVSKLEAALKNL